MHGHGVLAGSMLNRSVRSLWDLQKSPGEKSEEAKKRFEKVTGEFWVNTGVRDLFR